MATQTRTEPLEPRSRVKVNPRLLELQTAKEILAEIFHARLGEVEEMIQNRLEGRFGASGQRKGINHILDTRDMSK
jgi:hypothetical protein